MCQCGLLSVMVEGDPRMCNGVNKLDYNQSTLRKSLARPERLHYTHPMNNSTKTTTNHEPPGSFGLNHHSYYSHPTPALHANQLLKPMFVYRSFRAHTCQLPEEVIDGLGSWILDRREALQVL